MIITKTPFRVSFVGGGTDLASYFKRSEGAVISTSIKKYLYVIVRKQEGIGEFKYRINWSKVEFKNNINDIENPIARECLKFFRINIPLEVSTFADIPAETGLGSSSAFCVGLVHALSLLLKKNYSKYEIAKIAANIEIKKLKRPIGKQDHFASALGGVNKIIFQKNDNVKIKKLPFNDKHISKFKNNFLMFYMNTKRNADEVLIHQNVFTKNRFSILSKIKALVDPLEKNFRSGIDEEFGNLLHKNWILKKQITNNISSKEIDNLYKKLINLGAVGGKLLGAGKGGFILIYVKKSHHKKIKNKFGKFKFIELEVDTKGTVVVLK